MRKTMMAAVLAAATFSNAGVTAAGAIVGYVSDMKCATSGSSKKAAAE